MTTSDNEINSPTDTVMAGPHCRRHFVDFELDAMQCERDLSLHTAVTPYRRNKNTNSLTDINNNNI